jgi:predicted permease
MIVWNGLISFAGRISSKVSRSPGFWITCFLCLVVGLGGATAAFSALYAIVLRPLPYTDPNALVAVHNSFPRLQMPDAKVSPPDYRDLKQHTEVFRNAGVYFYVDLNRTGIQVPQKVNAVAATASLFETLDVKPLIGRAFNQVEQVPGGPHAVILSHSYWLAQFGGLPDVLRKTIRLNNEPYPVIGVMPPSFVFPNLETQMWVPVVFKPDQLLSTGRQMMFLRMYARLQPGVSLSLASKQMDRISREAKLLHKGEYTLDLSGWKYFVRSLKVEESQPIQSWAWIFFAAVMVLLLILCANVGGMLLLRSTERSFEIAIRLALGANRFRIVLHTLAEVATLCGASFGGGLLLSVWIVRLLNLSGQFGRVNLVLPVFLFGAVATLLVTLFCSLFPVYALNNSDAGDTLKSGGFQRTASRSKQTMRSGLIVSQVAACMLLLVFSSLLLRSYARLAETPLGFEAGGVHTMQISLPPLKYSNDAARISFYERVLERLQQIPGVEASACTVAPFGYGETLQLFRIAGHSVERLQQAADTNLVLPKFFETLKIPLLKGRYLGDRDRIGSERSVVIDQAFSQKYFAQENAIGKQIEISTGGMFTVVGIVGSAKTNGLDVENTPTLYLSALQLPVTDMSLLVKSSSGLSDVPKMVQDVVTNVDHDQPVYDFATLQSRIDRSLSTRKLVNSILLAFAAVGTAITGVGIYGLLSYSLTLRQRELGIRSALGATPGAIALAVFHHSFALVLLGVTIGAGFTFLAIPWISSAFYGVNANDPPSWLVAGVLLFTACVVSSALPSLRAFRLSPLHLLSHD